MCGLCEGKVRKGMQAHGTVGHKHSVGKIGPGLQRPFHVPFPTNSPSRRTLGAQSHVHAAVAVGRHGQARGALHDDAPALGQRRQRALAEEHHLRVGESSGRAAKRMWAGRG